MHSRRDDIEPADTRRRALLLGLCGMGEAADDRAERRLMRFIAAPDGAFVWTHHDGMRLGRLTGPWRRDDDGAVVDLVHVRPCDWVAEPVDPALVPAAVTQTFARGGRNLQRIHPDDVEEKTAALWDRLGD